MKKFFIIFILTYSSFAYNKPINNNYIAYDRVNHTYVRNISQEFKENLNINLSSYIETQDLVLLLEGFEKLFISYNEISVLLNIVKLIEQIKKGEIELEYKIAKLDYKNLVLSGITASNLFEFLDQAKEQNKLKIKSFTNELQKYAFLYIENYKIKNSKNLTDRYDEIIIAIAENTKIPSKYISNLIKIESNFNPYAISQDGAIGLTQIMPFNIEIVRQLLGIEITYEPALDENGNEINIYGHDDTQKKLKFLLLEKGKGNIWEHHINISVGVALLQHYYNQLFTGTNKHLTKLVKTKIKDLTNKNKWNIALMAYNAGIYNVQKWLKSTKRAISFKHFIKKAHPETRKFISRLSK